MNDVVDYWFVSTPYANEEGHSSSQLRIMRRFYELGGTDIKWVMGVGYAHVWKIFDEHEALTLLLACGSKIQHGGVLRTMA